MYNIVIRKQAKKKLQSLSEKNRIRISEKIFKLGLNPDDPSLDIKKMSGDLTLGLELEIGELFLINKMKSK